MVGARLKTSWMIGLIMIWLLIFAFEMVVTNAAVFNPGSLLNPAANVTITSGSGFISNIWAVLTHLGPYIKGLLRILFLYEPSVFAGNYIWFWYFICLPIDIGIIFSIVTMLRGSSSN